MAMSNHILVLADTHCNYRILEGIIDRELDNGTRIGAVLHCGDMGIYDVDLFDRLPLREQNVIKKHHNSIDQFKPFLNGEKQFKLPIYAIPGNHEDFLLIQELQEQKKCVNNLTILSPIERITIPGMPFSIMGMGKILPMHISSHRSKQDKIIQPEEINALAKTAKNTPPSILLLHEPPYVVHENGGRAYGNPKITNLIVEIAPDYVFTGHIHTEYQAQIGDTQIVGLGYGANGRYALLDDEYNLEFRALHQETIEINSFSIGDASHLSLRREERKRNKESQMKRVLTAKEIIRFFGLDNNDKEVKEMLCIISRQICEMQKTQEIKTRSEALRFAEDYLRRNRMLNA